MKLNAILIFVIVIIIGCNSSKNEQKESVNQIDNTLNTSTKSRANLIADSVMLAMGGQDAWNKIRFIKWNFFGVRDLVWDKKTGRVRIDFSADSSIYLINISTNKGQIKRNGEILTQQDSIAKYVKRGISIWNNDAYWLFMPFKLQDDGVTLNYLRTDSTQKGALSDVLSLTFDNVGDTPNNKYEVFVDKNSKLITQWNYYKNASQDSASAIWPWDNYKAYHGVLLSADRSDDKGPKDVVVYDSLPNQVFEKFERPSL